MSDLFTYIISLIEAIFFFCDRLIVAALHGTAL